MSAKGKTPPNNPPTKVQAVSLASRAVAVVSWNTGWSKRYRESRGSLAPAFVVAGGAAPPVDRDGGSCQESAKEAPARGSPPSSSFDPPRLANRRTVMDEVSGSPAGAAGPSVAC